MMRRQILFRVPTLLVVFCVASLAGRSVVLGQVDEPAPRDKKQAEIESQIRAATTRASEQGYLLAYRFEKGQSLRMKVIQLVSMETRIDGVDQNVQSRSVSTRQWDVTAVDRDGNITFVHSVRNVSMWQKVTGQDEIRYDSTKKGEVPEVYRAIAEKLGKPLSTITMAANGRVVRRENQAPQFDAGIDSLVIPLPGKAVKVGYRWYTPEKLRIRTKTGIYRTVQLRRQYKLEKVEAGVATISVTTQVLTPLDDPQVKSQIVQRLQDGTIRFDIDRGRIVSRQMNLDQRVIGFNGPTSLMHYLARTREEVLEETTFQ